MGARARREHRRVFRFERRFCLPTLPCPKPTAWMIVPTRRSCPAAGASTSTTPTGTTSCSRRRPTRSKSLSTTLQTDVNWEQQTHRAGCKACARPRAFSDVMRVRPVLGRLFNTKGGRPARRARRADQHAALAERRSPARPTCSGRTLRLQTANRPHDIGVCRRIFPSPSDRHLLGRSTCRRTMVDADHRRGPAQHLGRLAPGVTVTRRERSNCRPSAKRAIEPNPQQGLVGARSRCGKTSSPAADNALLFVQAGAAILLVLADLQSRLAAYGVGRRASAEDRGAARLGASGWRLVRAHFSAERDLVAIGGGLGVLLAGVFPLPRAAGAHPTPVRRLPRHSRARSRTLGFAALLVLGHRACCGAAACMAVAGGLVRRGAAQRIAAAPASAAARCAGSRRWLSCKPAVSVLILVGAGAGGHRLPQSSAACRSASRQEQRVLMQDPVSPTRLTARPGKTRSVVRTLEQNLTPRARAPPTSVYTDTARSAGGQWGGAFFAA